MATTTPHHRLTRKDLRQPDEFVSLLDAASEYVATHLGRVIGAALALLALILLTAALNLYVNHRHRAAAEAFYSASQAYDSKQYQTAENRFQALANDYPGTSLGRLALLYMGDIHLAQNQAAPARDLLQRFLEVDHRPVFRQVALLQLGVAWEALGNDGEAHKAYAQAAAINEGQQGRAELELARLTANQCDKPGAIAIYQRFLREHPFGAQRTSVIDALARLGAAPEPGLMPNTIELPAK
jgi:tetratricopeptide (TPR) repeat protein